MKDKREGITPSRFRTVSAGQKPNGGRNLSVHRVFLDINLTLGFIIEPIRLTNQNPNEDVFRLLLTDDMPNRGDILKIV